MGRITQAQQKRYEASLCAWYHRKGMLIPDIRIFFYQVLSECGLIIWDGEKKKEFFKTAIEKNGLDPENKKAVEWVKLEGMQQAMIDSRNQMINEGLNYNHIIQLMNENQKNYKFNKINLK